MSIKITQLPVVGAFAIGLLLGGCEAQDPIFGKTFEPPKVRLTSIPNERLQTRKGNIDFVYAKRGRDPFQYAKLRWVVPPSRNPGTPVGIPARRPLSRLESFELDQLKLAAIVTSTANPLAIVEDPSGRGYVVRVGTAIGRMSGRVSEIKPGGLSIQIVTRHPVSGQRMRSLLKMPLHNKKGQLAKDGFVEEKNRLFIDKNGYIHSSKMMDTRTVY